MTTNRFDDDIITFNDNHISTITAYQEGKASFTSIYEAFDAYIRPKLRTFFKGGLTRRIDAVVPFFKFNKEEAYVVADMYVDRVREMYLLPRTAGTLHGDTSVLLCHRNYSEPNENNYCHIPVRLYYP